MQHPPIHEAYCWRRGRSNPSWWLSLALSASDAPLCPRIWAAALPGNACVAAKMRIDTKKSSSTVIAVRRSA